jgi:2-polyprenyl-3-methyl-5-hydroxy-6-metoxy-1,4-benzoquinol methylase
MSQTNFEHVNNWKDCKELFDKQLLLNYKEYTTTYPFHWNQYIELMTQIYIPGMKLLDIGCGCGFLHKINLNYFPGLQYYGVDYSPYAISLAKEHWQSNNFECIDIFDLDKEYIQNYDIIFSSGLTVVMPNGDQAIEKILSLDCKNIILSKLRCTKTRDSYFSLESPYGVTTSYVYYHNYNNLIELFKKYNYSLTRAEEVIYDYHGFFLKKNI